MNMNELRHRFSKVIMTAAAVGTLATSTSLPNDSLTGFMNDGASLQKLADMPLNREIKRTLKLQSTEKQEFAQLYSDISKQVMDKAHKLPELFQLFASIFMDISNDVSLRQQMEINELDDIREELKKISQSILLLDKALENLRKLADIPIGMKLNVLGEIIDSIEEVIQATNLFYSLVYHDELLSIVNHRQEVAFAFDEGHTRDDIRRTLFGEAE